MKHLKLILSILFIFCLTRTYADDSNYLFRHYQVENGLSDNMANKVGVTKRAIEKNIKNLRGMGILVHEGSDKAGYWRIVINPQTEL